MAGPVQDGVLARAFDRERLPQIADWLAVALAVSLPWSTSATGILAVLWLIAILPTLSVADVRRELMTPAGGLPVLLWGCGVAGMLWADVSFAERLEGLNSFHKLLIVPFLLAQFRRSGRGTPVLLGFLLSCSVLLAVSWGLALIPGLGWRGKALGIPVKDYVSQSAMFTVCICILVFIASDFWKETRRELAAALLLLAIIFLADILYLATSRTALVVIPVLLVVFGLVRFGWKGGVALLAALAVLVAVAWPSASYLRTRVISLFDEVTQYGGAGPSTSAGERLEFWKKSVSFVSQAPIVGHGTGSIPEQFRRAAVGQSGTAAIASTNPHNQTLAVAIQLGILGAVVLWTMWIVHVALFRGPTLVAWVGLVVVLQNVIGSLFNSHVFDFTHGWLYVIGTGIAGGIALRGASDPARNPPSFQPPL